MAKRALGVTTSGELCIEASAICSMAQQRIGHAEEARAGQAEGLEELKKLPELSSSALGEEWRDWIVAHLLCEEAAGLIK